MKTNVRPETARIYMFPIGGRSGLVGWRAEPKPAASAPQYASIDASGAGWYHAAAIQEAERARKS